MGEDTGFAPYDEDFDPAIRAGCELDWLDLDDCTTVEEARAYMADAPHIFKAPDWSFKLKGYLAQGFVEIDHIILPFRDFEESAVSRLSVGLDWMMTDGIGDGQERVGAQAAVHAMVFGRTVEVAYLYHIPLHIIRFPEFVHSARYCYERLTSIFDFDYDIFEAKHEELAWPNNS
jgi:hypothetical protein